MSRHLITALLLAFLFSCNPLISWEVGSPSAYVGDSTLLPGILAVFGFKFPQYIDGLRLLFFALIFIFLLEVIARKKYSLDGAVLLTALLLAYIAFVFCPERFSISHLLVFLLIGIVYSCIDRKNSVIFLMIGMLIKFWLSLLLIMVILALLNSYGKNRVLKHRLALALIDSILLYTPLILVLNYL